MPRDNKRPKKSERVEFKLGEKQIASRLRGNKRPVNSERIEHKPDAKAPTRFYLDFLQFPVMMSHLRK